MKTEDTKRHQAIGEFLRKKRKDCGLSQQQVASELGYTVAQYISNWERGLCLPPMNALKSICSLYNISQQHITKMLLAETRKAIETQFNKDVV